MINEQVLKTSSQKKKENKYPGLAKTDNVISTVKVTKDVIVIISKIISSFFEKNILIYFFFK